MNQSFETFPRLLLHHAQVRGDKPAIREKHLGIWQTWTWRQVADEVRSLACGLAAHGFRRGMHLAIIGDNRPWRRCRRSAAFPCRCTRTRRQPSSSTC